MMSGYYGFGQAFARNAVAAIVNVNQICLQLLGQKDRPNLPEK